MSTITKKWLQKAISQHEAMRDEIPFGLDEDDSNTLAALRIALASLEAEPDYVRYDCGCCGWETIEDWRENDVCPKCNHHPMGKTPLYTAPPAPVSVMDEAQSRELFEKNCMANIERNKWHPDLYAHLPAREQWAAWEACRAAMLQGSEQQSRQQNIPESIPVNTPCKDAPEHIWLQTAGVWPENGEFSDLTWCSDNQHPDDTLYVRADVVTGNSPVIPDGWVACSERMPESNKYVLVCNGVWVGMGLYNGGEQFEDCERWQDEHGEFIDLLHHPVSHWMPLPAAPQQEAKP